MFMSVMFLAAQGYASSRKGKKKPTPQYERATSKKELGKRVVKAAFSPFS